jgi:hypothetical protein
VYNFHRGYVTYKNYFTATRLTGESNVRLPLAAVSRIAG